MSKCKIGSSREYLKEINETCREPNLYYITLIEEIAHCLKTSTEPAGSIVLCDEHPDGKEWFNNHLDEDCHPIFPLGKYIIVNFPAGYYTKKKCLGTITVSKELHELLLSEGWTFTNHKSSFEFQYELLL